MSSEIDGSYTRQIELEQVTLEEFNRMEQSWQSFRNKRPRTMYTRVRHPIMDNDYERLLLHLVEHEFADELCVNERGHWVKQYVRRISDQEIRELAKIAGSDTLKRNYLEIKYKNGSLHCDRAVIEFREYGGQAIGYDVQTPRNLEWLFTVKQDYTLPPTFYKYIRGLWIP